MVALSFRAYSSSNRAGGRNTSWLGGQTDAVNIKLHFVKQGFMT